MWQTCHHLQGSMGPRCHRLPMILPCTVHIRQLLLLSVQFPQHWKILLVPSRCEVSRSTFPKRLRWSLPHTPEHAKVSQRACGFCCRMRKLNSFHKLVFWGLSLMTAFPGHLTSTQSARKLAAKLVLYVVCTGNWLPRQEGNSLSQWFSQIWSMLLQQPSPVHADWSTSLRSTSGALEKGSSMPGRCSSPRRCLTTDQKFKADSLISSLVPTTVHHHPTLSPRVCSGVTPEET